MRTRAGPVFLAALVAALAAGCQTAAPTAPAQLPVVLEPLFQPCLPGDGATTLQAFQGGALLGAGEAEWVARPNGDWDVEVSSAVGLTVLTVSRRGAEVRSTGPLAAKMPHLAVRKDGYLEVDGHLAGVKAGEVPCLLAFTLPRTWLPYVVSVEAAGQQARIHVADGTRDVEVAARHLGSPSQESACATLSWRKLLFFSQELVWCAHLTGRRAGSLSGLQDYSLKWVKIDEL